MSKKPCIWAECKSKVSILSIPAPLKRFAINFALIGVLAFVLLSCLAYPK